MTERNSDEARGKQVPDLYVDNMRVTTSPYGVNMTFARTDAHPEPEVAADRQSTPQVRLRMSLQHAKIMAMLLRKHLKTFERQAEIDIVLPAKLYVDLEIPEEDW